jgi:hypothetical protein
MLEALSVKDSAKDMTVDDIKSMHLGARKCG